MTLLRLAGLARLPAGVGCLISAGFLVSSMALISPAGAQMLAPDVAERVDKVFEKWDRTDSPGCALGIYQNGQIIYKRGYGMANLNDDVTITPETVFHVASMSKQFTAASILLLQQEGKLSIDDDVRKFLPELPDYGKKITILNLLNHTSGLRDYLHIGGGNAQRITFELAKNVRIVPNEEGLLGGVALWRGDL